MTETLDPERRIARYVDQNPDATVSEVLGALTLNPAEWADAVERALDAGDRETADESAESTNTSTRNDGSETATSSAPDGRQDSEPADGDGGDSTNQSNSREMDNYTPDQKPGDGDGVLDEGAGYADIFRRAQALEGRDPWEYVTKPALRAALDEAGHVDLLDHGVLTQMSDWHAVDFGDEDTDAPDWRYFYVPAAPDPRPDEFRQFHEALVDAAPDGYEPYYFRVEKAGKAPATEYGSWKDDVNRLTADEAIEWMERGGNVGIAGTPDDPLVNIDVDDGEATTPEDLPETLRARSRSRAGWHGWAFDPDDEIPNLPTDALGEVRTDWQYVVAPGSFVASTREEIPDDRLDDDPGYYTLEHEAPVATIGYDDLPEAFRDWHEQHEQHEQQTPPTDAESDGDLLDEGTDDERDQDRPTGDSAVFDVGARDVVRREGGSTDVSDRWAALFHGSSTSANMSLSDEGRLQCWRHNVAHGGLQALAALSDHSPAHACRKIGTGHTHSGAGGCQYSGDWRLIWWAWEYAKRAGYIPDDDPIPYRVLVNLAVRDGLVEREALVERPADDGDGSYLGFPDAAAYNAALEHVRDEYDRDPGRDAVDESHQNDAGARWTVETCEPPATDPDEFTADEYRARLRGDRFGEFLEADAPVVWADPAGSGKTTNATLAALERDRSTLPLFDKHEKAREVCRDDALPDEFDPFHIKGGGQKREAVCMDADHADEDCPVHGDTSGCPSMCPIYDLDEDNPDRRRYEAVRDALGDAKAHIELGDDLPHHDEDGACAWFDQFDDLESADHAVGVHEYQVLKTAREDRDVIVDETPRSLRDTDTVDVERLVRTANALEDVADAIPGRDDPVIYTARRVAAFVRDLVDELTATDPELETVDPPTPVWNAYETRDPAAGHYVEREEPTEDWHVTEALAQLKVAYTETIVRRVQRDEWDGTPVGLDSVLTAAAEAGLSTEAVLRAVAAPATLDTCPRCGSPTEAHNGARVCPDDGCGWDERTDSLTHQSDTPARARAFLVDDLEHGTALVYEHLPPTDDLPDTPLVLDATATPSKVAGLYGVDRDEIVLAGDKPLEANMHVTQVLDGQYHESTIRAGMTDDDGDVLPRDEWTGAAARIQSTIDTIAELHDRPLFQVKKALKPLFEFPDHGTVQHYGALRGLNREDCDAVVQIGAPHPDVGDLRREAELLARGTDLTVGGVEHSTRPDAPNPPVYRKLNYRDDQGRGRAVPTKHYTGLVGHLFREAREKELDQGAHRARPLLADEPVQVYRLTNVPTDLPVDEVCAFEELADPVRALLPVTDGAVDLLEAVDDVLDGNTPDGFRGPETLVEVRDDGTIANKVKGYHRLARLSGLDVTERTVRNYVDDLEAVGLLRPEGYEPRAGVSYSTDVTTLKTALSVLTSNGGFKVAALRRLRSLATAADGSLAWLQWAREALDLRGDRCEWDPPPTPPG